METNKNAVAKLLKKSGRVHLMTSSCVIRPPDLKGEKQNCFQIIVQCVQISIISEKEKTQCSPDNRELALQASRFHPALRVKL